MKLRWFIAVLLPVSFSAFAGETTQEGGSWSSGGGSAVACFTDRSVAAQVQAQKGLVTNDQLGYIDSIEVLDLFEWKRPRGIDGRKNLPLAEPRAGESYISFTARISARAYATLAIHSPTREASLGNVLWSMGADLQENLRGGDSERFIWTGTSLVNLQDEGTPMRFAGNCALVPLAVQQGEKHGLRIFIDDRLFFHPKHSVQSQAALLVHEFVYSYARELGHPNSSATRRAVGLLMQNDPETRVQDILAKIEGIGFLSAFEGLRKIHSYGRMKITSGLAYSAISILGEGKKIWLDRSFRASSGSREERVIVAEVAAFLREEGVAWDESRDLNANRAAAYLRAFPGKSDLLAELEAIVQGKKLALSKTFIELIHQEGAFWLQNVPGLSEQDRMAIIRGMEGFFLNQVLPLASTMATDEELNQRRAQEIELGLYSHPIFTFDELVQKNSRDGNFSDVFYWLSDSIAREFIFGPKTFNLYGYKMPVL